MATATRVPSSILIAVLFLLGCNCNTPVEAPDSDSGSDSLVTEALRSSVAVDQAMEAEIADGLVGIAIGIAENDKVVFLGGYGMADREEGIAVDPSSTLFRWASLSKGLTAVVGVIGQGRGELSVDDEVEDIVQEYRVPELFLPEGCAELSCAETLSAEQRTISLKRLLSHTGGVQHYSNGLAAPVPESDQSADPTVNTGMDWALPLWIDSPLIALPGTTYSYTTVGYNLAGVAIERARGASLAELVEQDVSSKVGITTLQPDYIWDDLPARAQGYYKSEDLVFPREDAADVSWKLAGGGFISTVEDMARYCAGLNTHAFMTETLRDDVLWTPPDTEINDYALGFWSGSTDHGPRFSHGGAQPKTRTSLAFWPEEGLCIAVMTNSEYADAGGLRDAVEQAWRSENPQ